MQKIKNNNWIFKLSLILFTFVFAFIIFSNYVDVQWKCYPSIGGEEYMISREYMRELVEAIEFYIEGNQRIPSNTFELQEATRDYMTYDSKHPNGIPAFSDLGVPLDEFRRPILYRAVVAENSVTIILISMGRNGVLENGKGDDIYLKRQFDIDWKFYELTPRIKKKKVKD